MNEAMIGVAAGAAAGIGLGLSAGHRAQQLGHDVEIEQLRKRFRIVCSCGWRTQVNWTRRRQFEAATMHVLEVISEGGRRVASENASGGVE